MPGDDGFHLVAVKCQPVQQDGRQSFDSGGAAANEGQRFGIGRVDHLPDPHSKPGDLLEHVSHGRV